MKEDLTQISIVLDRSGSMSSVREATVSGYNEFIEGQRKGKGEAAVSLIQFDTENPYEVLYQCRPIGEVKKLAVEDYMPRGGTPLHDAIGKTIEELGKLLEGTSEDQRPGKVVVVIMTDGLENASSKFSGPKIAEMIKHQREVYNWQFIFLGANQDAILTGERLNIPKMHAASYSGQAVGTANAFAATSSNLVSYRTTGRSMSLKYSEKQRQEMMEENEQSKKSKSA